MPDTLQSSAAPTGTIQVDDPVVACDGGDGPLGHPRVFLRIVGPAVMCPYCSRRYELTAGAGPAPGH